MLLFFVLCFLNSSHASQECEQWFKSNQLDASSKDCLLECSSANTGMGTFNCTSECKHLCQTTITEDLLLTTQSIASYPGLTNAEKALVAQSPTDAVKVFLAKQKAEQLTMDTFKRNVANDESDAFRHFVWACLLTIDFGEEKAKQYLNAHETGSNQSDFSRAMDLSNNKVGISKAKQLIEKRTTSMADIKQAALEQLEQKKLIYVKNKEKVK